MNFEEVYERLFNKVFAYIRSRVRAAEQAEDIAARTWQKVWDKQQQFDARRGLPEQWIFTIARNEVNKQYRWYALKRLFSMKEEIIPDAKTPLEALSLQERQTYLYYALQKLPQREQDLLSLKFYSGLNNRQIARLVGISESNVGTIVNRALQKLRAVLEEL